jgi:hypothetical protein
VKLVTTRHSVRTGAFEPRHAGDAILPLHQRNPAMRGGRRSQSLRRPIM